jgi:mRNA interferase MazF
VSFERFTVVRVPFPFTDRNATKNRPALVLSDAAAFNTPAGHSVMAMITSQGNAPWPLDCAIVDLASAGLPSASIVRFKLFTLDHRLVRGALGMLSVEDIQLVTTRMAQLFYADTGKVFP